MSLTSKQRKQLKRLGQHLEPQLKVGKAGLKETLGVEMNLLLRQHELVKVRFPAGEPRARKQLAADLAESMHAQLVGGTGRIFLFYRININREESKRIRLEEEE